MINNEQLREQIILPALSKLNQYSADAVELLVFTCAVESNGGTYVKQVKGPALGIYQMEPATYNDLWQNFVRKRADLSTILGAQFNCFHMPPEDRMIYDLQFATVMARIFYLRAPGSIPKKDDLDGIWNYYKKFWNTELGKAKKDQCIKAYKQFIGTIKSKDNDEG